ncbi:BHLH domain-containing protein [Favolaschia claudopus]|uniref:BHLH domain-containing protein n=1 Tax=Favolaschia claudopus TaxID=2862362 RepID=A0AAV9ZDM2_9AGAR
MASEASTHSAALRPAPAAGATPDVAQLQAVHPDPEQLMNILRYLPDVFTKQLADGTLKEDAAQTLSNLSQFAQGGTGPGGFHVSDPGPSSHPHGPPPPLSVPQHGILNIPTDPNIPPVEEGGDNDDDGEYGDNTAGETSTGRKGSNSSGRGRGRGNPMTGSDEWVRQRKHNHKEVERRRRGNINEGINELSRIVPNGAGTDNAAKAAILSRAVQYIHHLKENEARNIEKWTLEKLLMDQAMGDLQVQLDEIRRIYDEERTGRLRAQQELEMLLAERKRAASADGSDGGEGSNKRTKTE